MANKYTLFRQTIVDGKKTAAALRAMGKGVPLTVTEGVAGALEPIYVAQVSYCPVRADLPSSAKELAPGEMKASIRKKLISYPRTGKAVGLVGPTGRAGKVAHLVENGHLAVAPIKRTSIRKGTAKAARNGTTHVPPHPFIRPSVLNTLGAQAAAFTSKAAVVYVKVVGQAKAIGNAVGTLQGASNDVNENEGATL